MRRILLAVLMINLILLGGCGYSAAADEAKIEEFRTQLEAASAMHFQAKLKADDGTNVSEYELDCRQTEDEMYIQLLSPQLIAGVSALVREGSTQLEFDGLSFDTGSVGTEGLSPIAAPAVISRALCSGTLSQIRRETYSGRECIAFRVVNSEGVNVELRLDAETMTPLYAEIVSCEQAVIFCTVSDWDLEEG